VLGTSSLRAQALTTTQISIDTSGQGSGDAAVGLSDLVANGVREELEKQLKTRRKLVLGNFRVVHKKVALALTLERARRYEAVNEWFRIIGQLHTPSGVTTHRPPELWLAGVHRWRAYSIAEGGKGPHPEIE